MPFEDKKWHDEIEATDTPISAAALKDMETRLSEYTDKNVTTTAVRHGEGVPSAELGINGDFYIDTLNNKIYGPKTAGAWGSGVSDIGPTGVTGPTGTAGKTVLNGSGAPSNELGADGDFYIDTATDKIYGPKASGVWPAGIELKGAAGRNVGLKYAYSSTTTEADPETGKLRLNNATLSSVTALYISETDGDAASTASWIQTWDDSTSEIKGYVTITKDADPSQYALYRVNAVTDKGTWDKVTLTYQTGHGSFTDGDNVRIAFARTGDKGNEGASGISRERHRLSESIGYTTGGDGEFSPLFWVVELWSGIPMKIHFQGEMTYNATFTMPAEFAPTLEGWPEGEYMKFPIYASAAKLKSFELQSGMAWLNINREGHVFVTVPSGVTLSSGSVDLTGIYYWIR